MAGALGLILPGVFRTRQRLTPLAAAGLVIIMTGATVLTAIGMGILPALFPLVVGALAAAVAYWRRDGHTAAFEIRPRYVPLRP